MSQFEVMLQCEDEEQRLLVSSFVNSLIVDIKRVVKIQPLYFLNVAYQKALNYEKYLRVILMCVPFSLDTRPSHPSTFPRSHSSTQPVNSASPSGSTPSASSTSLAKITLASSSACLFTSQIECHYCHVKGHIVSRCP